MKKTTLLLSMAAAAVVTVAIPAFAAVPHAKDIAGAQAAARPWLSLVDAQKYSASWKSASIVFRMGVTEKKWDETVKQVRDQTGALKSRSLLHSEFTTSLPGGPTGSYVVIQYSSKFATTKAAVETVVMMRDSGKWKAAGYFVRPGE